MLADSITEMIGAGVLAPAAIALGVYWLASRLLPAAAASRDPIALALVSGFVVGYYLLHGSAAVVPSRHWHWLPWLGLAAGVTGCLAIHAGKVVWWLLMLATCGAAAWFLVPTWASLEPPRVVWLIELAAIFCMLIGQTERLPSRSGGRLVVFLLGLTAAVMAATIAASVSLTYGQIAGLAACALGGVWTGMWLTGRDDELATRAAVPAALILIGGIAFVGCIEPEPPNYGLLLLPGAPLGLSLCQIPALRGLTGRTATVVRICSVVVPLLAAAAVAYARVL
ncbi:MAG: hypothetical protein U0992_22035 [Planctomycetaceae bacterium]